MTITVGPTLKCTHHLSLKDTDDYEIGLLAAALSTDEDGNSYIDKDIKRLTRSPIDRTAMKTSSGDTEYSDWRPPYYALKQDDFSGGRGQDDFNRDKTKFLDSGGLNTRRAGYVHLNGQEQLSGLIRSGGQHQPGNMAQPSVPSPDSTEWATKVIPDTTTTYDQIWIWSHLDTAISGVKLYDGDDAAFETPIVTDPVTLVTTPPSFAPGWHIINLDTAISISSTNGIWISVPLVAGTTKYAPDDAITGYLKQAGSPVEDDGFPCRVVVKKAPSFGRFFKLWNRLYYLQVLDGVARIWKNGYAGMLSTGGSKTVTDSTFSGTWTEDELAGATFLVRSGTGFGEHQRWRKILSNTTIGGITFEESFDNALGTDTFYCILGTDHWEEIPGGTPGSPAKNSHGLYQYIHDVLVSDQGVAYIAMGSAFAMYRMWEGSTASDAGDLYFALDADAPGPRYLCQVGPTIWGVENSTFQAKPAPAGASFTDALTNKRIWGASVSCGDRLSPFTGIMEYTDGAGVKSPMIFKEGEFGFIQQNAYNRVHLDEYKVLGDARNGRAHLAHDTNAYFSFGSGLERWYYPNLDDVGPNRDEGLPETRAGDVRCLAGYPGRFFAGIDAGSSGYSSVLSPAYHEEWRGAYGQRILSVMPQTIPGSTLDRLWIAVGGDLLWVPMPSDTPNPLNDSNMLYTAGGYIETSSYYTELKTALKYISLIKFIFNDILSEQYSEVEYSLDEGTTWTDLDDAANPTTDDSSTIKYNLTTVTGTSPSYTGYYGLSGYSVRLRIKLFTTDKTKTPVLKALVMEGLARIDNKYAYTIPFVLEGTALDHAKDLLGGDDLDSDNTLTTADGKLATLIDWADEGPLLMKSQDPRFDGKMVLMLPFAESLVEYEDASGKRVYLGQVTVQDA